MPAEIHLDDVGTEYYCRVRDQDGDFDPTSAATKLLRFLSDPDGAVLVEKDAAVVSEVVEGLTRWYLVYEAEAGFHATLGPFKLQGRVIYDTGKQWSSDIRTSDDEGSPLEVHANL